MAKAMKEMKITKAIQAAAPSRAMAKAKKIWPGFRPVSVGGGLETIWARPGSTLWTGYAGYMWRMKVNDKKNHWVKMDNLHKQHKQHKKDKKDKKVKKVKN